MDFDKYVCNWFAEYLENHAEQAELIDGLFVDMGYTVGDLLPDETKLGYLQGLDDAEDIYRRLFGWGTTVMAEDLPDTESFLREMFMHCGVASDYSFSELFVDDMAMHAADYSSPVSFFNDLAYGGCASGMIGMLIPTSDCRSLYIEYLDDMEIMLEQLESEIGGPVRKPSNLDRPTWLCWLCYEQLAYAIGRELFPDKF